ncbi:MAG: helix-turn-helix domain-containing protein [Ktedonobacteraceae bacterium]
MSLVDNPYRNRKAVADPALFCGRHGILFLIAEKIRHGQMCAIAGEPLIGKTSLLYYLVHPQGAWSIEEFKDYLGDPDHYLFVLIELGRLPIRNANGFFRYLFDRVVEEAEKLDTKSGETRVHIESAQTSGDDYETQRLFEHYLKRLERRVIFLFDDFDIVVNELNHDDVVKIMQKIRVLTQALDLLEKLNCIFVSTDPLQQLFNAKGFTINSPLSRIILDYEFLRPMDDEEVEQLIKRPLQQLEGKDFRFTPEEITFIQQIAGHHPGMVKSACFHLFEAKFRKQELIAPIQIRQILEKDPNVYLLMETLWQRVAQSEQQEGLPLTRCLTAIAQGRAPADLAALEVLHHKGFIDSSASEPWIWGDMFRRFILRKNIETRPNTESSSISKNDLAASAGYKLQEPLAPLEDKLFNYLAQNIERTCGRAELHQALWGDKLPRSRDALEQLIKRIREKIEPHPDYPEYLLTVRGQGYLLRKRSKE